MMIQKEKLIVACGGDDRFALPLAITLYSALKNLSLEIFLELLLLDGGISETNKKRIERTLLRVRPDTVIQWASPDFSKFPTLVTTEHLTKSAYSRLCLPYLMGLNAGNVLYIDSDVLVQGDLNEIRDTKFKSSDIVLAVRDLLLWDVQTGIAKTYKEVGLRGEEKYFNSGVLYINMERWRRAKVTERVLNYTHDYKDTITLADQDGLNYALYEQWGNLSSQWNVPAWEVNPDNEAEWPHWKRDEAEKKEWRQIYRDGFKTAKILHFAGKEKPWKINRCTYPERLYLSYVKESGYFTPGEYRWFIASLVTTTSVWHLKRLQKKIKN